jgi:hypothetical protein
LCSYTSSGFRFPVFVVVDKIIMDATISVKDRNFGLSQYEKERCSLHRRSRMMPNVACT